VAIALFLAMARGAEQNPLIGATRDQVLTRYGEPKSHMAQGNREILLYPRERIILRDDVVIEVEAVVADASRRGSSSETPSAPSPSASAPTAPGTAATTPPTQATPPNQTPSTSAPKPSAPAPEPQLAIKLVRPPSSKDARPTPSATPPPTQETVPPKTSTAPAIDTTTSERPAPVPTPITIEPQERVTSPTETPVEPTIVPAAPSAEERKAQERAIAEEKQKKAEALKEARRRLAEASTADATTEGIPTRTYLYAFLIIAGGIGYFIWRYRQRQFELAATSVSNTPLATPAAAPVMNKGRVFTAEQLNKMAWSRFEELVAEYYSKTGVVAVRTKTGPDTPVHLKISWKGEPRPFAYVQCVAHPSGLIDAKPVQDFAAALSADDIRRGYVVTTGKFSVPARDLAEEKHITLLPGDIFLEKLNALPPKARSEIMQAIHAGE
jgi:hypothetical protein